MKKYIFLTAFIVSAVFIFARYGQSQIQSYYSGDAVSFYNQLYVATTDTGSLEIFKLADKDLRRLVAVKPPQNIFEQNDFGDVKLVVDNGRLLAYAISESTLYKYELQSDSRLNLLASRKNTYWEWYKQVDLLGDNIVTISDQGVKIWNTEIMDVIDSLPVTNTTNAYNISANNNNYLLNIENNKLSVFSRETRAVYKDIAVNFKSESGNRRAYQDEEYNLYIVDDYYAKKFDMSGRLLGSFRHLDYDGYDINASGHTDYIYFSNGLGVVKLEKQNMTLVDSQNTTGYGGPRGWAMGLQTVYQGGDKLVLFNNNAIIVMNDKLELLASYTARELEELAPQESLFLRLDHNLASPDSQVILTGGGFLPGETLIFDFGGTKTYGLSDHRGRFSEELTVPTLDPGRYDIKVTGENSGLHYSIDFTIL